MSGSLILLSLLAIMSHSKTQNLFHWVAESTYLTLVTAPQKLHSMKFQNDYGKQRSAVLQYRYLTVHLNTTVREICVLMYPVFTRESDIPLVTDKNI